MKAKAEVKRALLRTVARRLIPQMRLERGTTLASPSKYARWESHVELEGKCW
jgi:hypothetical protein